MIKKKILAILTIFVVVLLFVIIVYNKDTYTINVEQVDTFSPDRKLIVYQNDKKIKFDEIQYIDGTYLCSETNPTVSHSEIIGVKELIIIINDKRSVKAKIVEK